MFLRYLVKVSDMNSAKDQRPNCLKIKILPLILASDDAEICEIAAAEGKNTFHVNILPNNGKR